MNIKNYHPLKYNVDSWLVVPIIFYYSTYTMRWMVTTINFNDFLPTSNNSRVFNYGDHCLRCINRMQAVRMGYQPKIVNTEKETNEG